MNNLNKFYQMNTCAKNVSQRNQFESFRCNTMYNPTTTKYNTRRFRGGPKYIYLEVAPNLLGILWVRVKLMHFRQLY